MELSFKKEMAGKSDLGNYSHLKEIYCGLLLENSFSFAK